MLVFTIYHIDIQTFLVTPINSQLQAPPPPILLTFLTRSSAQHKTWTGTLAAELGGLCYFDDWRKETVLPIS